MSYGSKISHFSQFSQFFLSEPACRLIVFSGEGLQDFRRRVLHFISSLRNKFSEKSVKFSKTAPLVPFSGASRRKSCNRTSFPRGNFRKVLPPPSVGITVIPGFNYILLIITLTYYVKNNQTHLL